MRVRPPSHIRNVNPLPPNALTESRRGEALALRGHARRSQFLLFSTPAVGQEEMDEVADTLRSGWITTGPKTKLFEAAFGNLVKAPDAVGLNSWTAGLHLGLMA